jgi:hypothetical protein
MGHNASRDDAPDTSMTPLDSSRRSTPAGHRRHRPAVGYPQPSRPGRAIPEEPAERPTIASRETADGSRVSTVRRPDGSSFTVSVPAGAMEDEAGKWSRRWITGDPPSGPASDAGLRRLADLVVIPGDAILASRRHGSPVHRHRLVR